MNCLVAKSIFTAPVCSRRVSQFFGLFVGMFLLCASLLAQGSAGSISGTVTDPSGASVPQAKVTVTDMARGGARTLTTDAAGAYAAPNLTPGNYSVKVEFQGFKTTDRPNIQLEVGQDIRVDMTLQPGDQTQTVTVTGEAAILNTSNAEVGGSLSNQVINDLPLNGRNFENLLDLRPGVTKYPGNSGWAQSTNGLRRHDNFFMVDGINSNDPWMAQSVMNAVMAAGDAGTMLPIDAIDEFKTNQNPAPNMAGSPARSSTSASNPAATPSTEPPMLTAARMPGMPPISSRPSHPSRLSSTAAASGAASSATNCSSSATTNPNNTRWVIP